MSGSLDRRACASSSVAPALWLNGEAVENEAKEGGGFVNPSAYLGLGFFSLLVGWAAMLVCIALFRRNGFPRFEMLMYVAGEAIDREFVRSVTPWRRVMQAFNVASLSGATSAK